MVMKFHYHFAFNTRALIFSNVGWTPVSYGIIAPVYPRPLIEHDIPLEKLTSTLKFLVLNTKLDRFYVARRYLSCVSSNPHRCFLRSKCGLLILRMVLPLYGFKVTLWLEHIMLLITIFIP